MSTEAPTGLTGEKLIEHRKQVAAREDAELLMAEGQQGLQSWEIYARRLTKELMSQGLPRGLEVTPEGTFVTP